MSESAEVKPGRTKDRDRGAQIKRLLQELEVLQTQFSSGYFCRSDLEKALASFNVQVDERTIQRDLKALCQLNFINRIDGSNIVGKSVQYRLTAKQLKLSSMPYESLFPYFYALKYLQRLENTSLKTQVSELRSRFRDQIRNGGDHRLFKFEQRFYLRGAAAPHDINMTQFNKIMEALPGPANSSGIGEGQVIKFKDRQGQAKDPHIKLEPHFMFVADFSVFVVGRDHLVSGNPFRVFSLSRLDQLTVEPNLKWTREVETVESYFQGSFGLTKEPGLTETVTLHFSPTVSAHIKDRIWHHSESKKYNRDGSVELTLKVRLETDLIRWVASFGKDVTVISSANLKKAIKDYLSAALTQYESTDPEADLPSAG